jgi:hypothetical protein
MLPEEYKPFIADLVSATTQNKLKWSRATGPNTLVATPNQKSRVLIDTYYSQVDKNVTSCINLTLFETPSNKLLDEIVICDQDTQDYELLKQLYQAARKQFADSGVNGVLTEISASLKA